MKARNLLAVLLLSSAVSGCHSPYKLVGVERTRLLIDSRYDVSPSSEAATIIAPYKVSVDSIMSPVVGEAARFLYADSPESPLSNLLSDVLMWASKSYGEEPVFSVYNIGGMRAAIAKGKVTVGDVLDVAPFENKICFLTLKGDKVLELFSQIALNGGEGVSRSVQLTITKDGKLLGATIDGNAIDPAREYRVVTLDYVAQGNDGMKAFQSGYDIHSPQDENNNVRFIIMDYFRQQMAQGRAVDADKDGRVVVKE